MPEFCFWSIGDGVYGQMLQTLVDSYRLNGQTADFHVFSDRNIRGAETHLAKTFIKKDFLFKLNFLSKEVQQLNYDYFIFLDADNFFVRKPLLSLPDLMAGSPIHLFFETDCAAANLKRKDWRGCPLTEYVRLMRDCGVKSEKVYNVNGGFFIVSKPAVEVVCGLAHDFWEYALRNGYRFTEEGPLAYATHMLCKEPEQHLLNKNFNLWCTDWKGVYADRLPDGKEWIFPDYFTFQENRVNPSIVHAIHSKQALAKISIEVN